MAAIPPQTLITEAQCYACYGVSLSQLLKLALWSRIAELAPVDSFINRSGITDATQIAALNVLTLAAKAHGWWDKCDLIYPFVGGTAQAHAQNLKSSQFTITWFGAVTHNANGITGDGATGYGDTGYIPSLSSILSLNSAHLSFYRRTLGANTRAYAGCLDASSGIVATKTAFTSGFNTAVNNSSITTIPGAATLALNMATRFISANLHGYSGGVDGVIGNVSVSVTALSLYVLAENNAGVTIAFNTSNLAGVTAGSSFTFAEYTVMAADWQTFNTALSRQV